MFFLISDGDYTHLSVNHSLHFKDPETGVHTNEIESLWRLAKLKCPAFNRTRDHFEGNLETNLKLT